MYLMVPKPLDSFNLLKVKGKVLKQRVLHASCDWYVPPADASHLLAHLVKTTHSWAGTHPSKFAKVLRDDGPFKHHEGFVL